MYNIIITFSSLFALILIKEHMFDWQNYLEYFFIMIIAILSFPRTLRYLDKVTNEKTN